MCSLWKQAYPLQLDYNFLDYNNLNIILWLLLLYLLIVHFIYYLHKVLLRLNLAEIATVSIAHTISAPIFSTLRLVLI